MGINVKHNDTEIKSPKIIRTVAAVAAGCAVSHSVRNIGIRPIRMIAQKITKISDKNLAREFYDGVMQVFKKSKLRSKGVSIINPLNKKIHLRAILQKEIQNDILLKFMPGKIKKSVLKGLLKNFRNARTAAYLSNNKKIVLPHTMLFSGFHEMGHALNANFGKITKVIQKCRRLTLLGMPIGSVALLKTKKAKNENTSGPVDKTTTFIKNNVGKLTFATFMPLLAEEAIASIKGNRLAKSVLRPELAKQVARNNMLAYSTYLISALASSVAIFVGVKAKDAVVSNQKNK